MVRSAGSAWRSRRTASTSLTRCAARNGTSSPRSSPVCRDLPGGSLITVEPGGAVELSGPPMDGVCPAITAMAADRAVLRSAFAKAGLGLVLLGADPLRPAKRVNPGDRYRAMEQFFTASQTGAAGAAMMTSTASVQVNLEAGPQADWAARVRLAHALGPTMVAIAANSPLLGGKFTGWRSSRQWVWSQLDSARCGPILGVNGEDPASDWARYAHEGTGDAGAPHARDGRSAGDGLGAVRRLGRRPGAARRPPTDDRRPRLPPDDAVPAGAAAPVPGDPLPRQRARRAVARRGVHPHHAARRPGRRRHRR